MADSVARELNYPVDELYEIAPSVQNSPHVTPEMYESMYKESLEQPSQFWDKRAKELIQFNHPYDAVVEGEFQYGNVSWFTNGKLNVAANCVDRHARNHPKKVAFYYEADDPTSPSCPSRAITYEELLREVCRCANLLKRWGVQKGESVCIYLPMIPEVVYFMLACARIGAPHSVVFAGFSSEALKDRIVDCRAKVLVTADQGLRGGRPIHLKKLADAAIDQIHKSEYEEQHHHQVEKVIVVRRTGAEVKMEPGRDIWYHETAPEERPYCPIEWVDSEDPLFYLYTSGSTGKPKGLMHTSAGYLLYAALTTKYDFDLKEDDVYCCVADVGWITGHTYIVYGPLCLGVTSVLFESTPLYPDAGRYWSMVEKYKVSAFYTAPTAIRLLMKYDEQFVTKYDRSSLRCLGTVGEPINPPAWKWYYEIVGDKKAAIVDTFWQTESGGHLLVPIPGATRTKPGSATRAFFGIEACLLHPTTGEEIKENDQQGVLAIKRPWPGMARSIFGNHQRYLDVYFRQYPGYYFTGDGAYRDKDGYFWIIGRVDDVVNVSGHRIGTAELETALIHHDACNEAAVVAIPHDVKGQAVWCFCVLRSGYEASIEVATELKMTIRQNIGPFAQPDAVVLVQSLPKTRSGKIMRRVLRKAASGEIDQIGDISTMADQEAMDHILEGLELTRKWLSMKK